MINKKNLQIYIGTMGSSNSVSYNKYDESHEYHDRLLSDDTKCTTPCPYHVHRYHMYHGYHIDRQLNDPDYVVQQYIDDEKFRAQIGSLQQLKDYFVEHDLCSISMSIFSNFTKFGSHDRADVIFAIKAYCNSSYDLANLIQRLYDETLGLLHIVSRKDLIDAFTINGFVNFKDTIKYGSRSKISKRSQRKKDYANNFMISVMDRLQSMPDDNDVCQINYLTVYRDAVKTNNYAILHYLRTTFSHIAEQINKFDQLSTEFHSVVQEEFDSYVCNKKELTEEN